MPDPSSSSSLSSAAPTTPPRGSSSSNDMNHRQSQNPYENPWESAANDRHYNSAVEAETPTSTIALLNGDTNHTTPSRQVSCAFQCFQACHVVDIFGASSLLIYDLLQVWNADQMAAIALLSLASVWMVRGVLAKTTRCGVSVSATISFALGLLYGSCALILWGLSVAHNQKECLLFPSWWCGNVGQATMALLLVILATYEGIRYIWIRQWMWQESTQVRDDLNVSEMEASPRRPRAPWWWTTNSTATTNYQEPLLQSSRTRPHWSTSNDTGYSMDAGVGTPVRSGNWWPFGGRRRGRSSSGARDDASVEYASLNEDWASRSEQDPFWWTRDDNHNNANGGQT